MKVGLRQLLLIAAVVLFVVAALSSGTNSFDLLAYGLASTAAALVVEELGIGRGMALGRRGWGRRR